MSSSAGSVPGLPLGVAPEAVATLRAAEPVSVVRSRLEALLERLSTTEPSAIELIRVNRIIDTAEKVLRLPRLSRSELHAIDAVILSQERDIAESSQASVTDQSTQTRVSSHTPASPIAMISEVVAAQAFCEINRHLEELTGEMQQRAEEANHLAGVVTYWRGEALSDMAWLCQRNQRHHDNSLAELRYLRSKLDGLVERVGPSVLDINGAQADWPAQVADAHERSKENHRAPHQSPVLTAEQEQLQQQLQHPQLQQDPRLLMAGFPILREERGLEEPQYRVAGRRPRTRYTFDTTSDSHKQQDPFRGYHPPTVETVSASNDTPTAPGVLTSPLGPYALGTPSPVAANDPIYAAAAMGAILAASTPPRAPTVQVTAPASGVAGPSDGSIRGTRVLAQMARVAREADEIEQHVGQRAETSRWEIRELLRRLAEQ